jgi:hypothetical protein
MQIQAGRPLRHSLSMKLSPVLSVAFILLVPLQALHAQEPLSAADKALFDDLRVTEETEKTARQRIEKSEKAAPQPDLPSGATKLLDRLAVYEASLSGVADEMITLSRKTLCGQLIKLSAAAEPAKTELIAAAKNIEGLPPAVELPAAETESDLPGEWLFPNDSRWYYQDGRVKTNAFTGTWRWVDQSSRVIIADYANTDYVDILRMVVKNGKPPILQGINQKNDRWTLSRGKPDPGRSSLPPEAAKLIAAARGSEAAARSTSLRQAQEKRERVAAWLVERAKTDPPAAAKALLASAGKLRTPVAGPAGEVYRRKPDTFRGKVYVDPKRRTWEFLPNGSVKTGGLSWGTWEWAKAGNDACLVLCGKLPGKPAIPMLVRGSASSPGTLHFIGYDEKFDANLKP